MTYHSMGSSHRFAGMSGGLGAIMAEDDRIRIRFEPMGVGASNELLTKIKNAINDTRLFKQNPSVTRDVMNTILARVTPADPEVVGSSDLRVAADKMLQIAASITSSGIPLRFDGIRNDTKNEYLHGTPSAQWSRPRPAQTPPPPRPRPVDPSEPPAPDVPVVESREPSRPVENKEKSNLPLLLAGAVGVVLTIYVLTNWRD